ncbi:MAG: GGDEF domain-containing protein [Nitrospirae bacterium]|nr:GGDEF domain-containing protein [Nitrospirota bacterium]
MGSKNSLLDLIDYLHRRTSLAFKMVVISVLAGVSVWVVLDYIQSRKLKDIFHAQLEERLGQQALRDRLNFDKYVKSHLQLAKLFISQKSFGDYVESRKWHSKSEENGGVKYYDRYPPWFPQLSVLRGFAQPRFVALADAQGEIREVYSERNNDIPSLLLHPSPLLLAKSDGDNFITEINGLPFLIASKSYSNNSGELKAILLVASPFDEEFLSSAAGYLPEGHFVALLTSEEKPRILMSSSRSLSPGLQLDLLQEKYLITGMEFFDYGSAERAIRLISLISKSEVESLTKTVFLKERQHRAIAAPIFILFFTLIMLWITRRVQRLTSNIAEFSTKHLGVPMESMSKGDQLMILEESYRRLTDEVLESREQLVKEAEERMVLERRNLMMGQKERQLELLMSVTETLNVGILIHGANGLEAANKQMEHFISACGGADFFTIGQGDVEERTVVDRTGINHIFEVSGHTIIDEKIILVRDITELKAHTELLEHMALHDSLTGLPNRTLFYDRLEHAIYMAQREESAFAVLMIDLDGFKLINDTLGHHIGDLVLQEIAKRMLDVLRKADSVARLGGDEFGVLLLKVDGINDAKEVAYKLLNNLKRPMGLADESLNVGASIGIVLYPDHGNSTDSLVRNADLSMYVAKRSGRGVSVYARE